MATTIHQVEVSNFKRISLAQASVDATGVVRVTGNNGEGKSSLLDAIFAALAGAKNLGAEPVRNGAESGYVQVKLTDGFTVTRHFKRSDGDKITTRVTIADANGMAPKRPQEWLDARLGVLQFDPSAFSRMDAKKQGAALARAVGLDLGEIDDQIRQAEQERTEAGRAHKRALAALESTPLPAVVPTDEALAEAAKAVNELEAKNREFNAYKGKLSEIHYQHQQTISEITKLKERIAELENTKACLWSTIKQIESNPVPEPPPLQEVLQERDDIYESREQSKRHHMAREAEAEACRELAERSDAVYHLRAERALAIADANMPVEGLDIDNDGNVRLKGVLFENLSQAEKLRVSMALALHAAPDIKIIQLREASLMDDATLAEVARMAEEHGAQVWAEIVGSGRGGIEIVDGGNVAAEAKEAA